jgi:hypothetical protein
MDWNLFTIVAKYGVGKNKNAGKNENAPKRNKTQQVETCWACCQV